MTISSKHTTPIFRIKDSLEEKILIGQPEVFYHLISVMIYSRGAWLLLFLLTGGRNFFAKKSRQTESRETWRAEGDYAVSSYNAWIHIFIAVVVHLSIYMDDGDVLRETPLAEIVVYSRDELPSC